MATGFPRVQQIPYRTDSAPLLEAVRHYGFPVFLDSGGRGRLDIVSADPVVRVVTRGEETRVIGRDDVQTSRSDPFDLVRELLDLTRSPVTDLPFDGGAIGYFGYDLGRRIERLPVQVKDIDGLPEMSVGIHDWAVLVDHEARQSWLLARGDDPRTAGRWDELVARLSALPEDEATGRPLERTGDLGISLDRAGYDACFARIQHFIHEGDCYQVNFALRFDCAVRGDPWSGYRAIRGGNPSPFGAFLDCGDFAVLSFSPERFLEVRGGRVSTSPIKGTRPRGGTPEEDRRLREALLSSDKDRAENLMIVDLLRNDLGRVCEPGSIRADRLFELESFATVHHLVSTVTGRLRGDEDALSLLRACFPGGSITGAPKIRAMELIEELEPCRRGVYCGAIGYVGFNGDMDTSIAIRTLVTQKERAWFWAGGGVVADSTAAVEYDECFHKAGFLLDYFGAGKGG
jgi:para-aminobenzoate synthetase component 1